MPTKKNLPTYQSGRMKQKFIVLQHLDTPLSGIEIKEITGLPITRVFTCLNELYCQKLIREDSKKRINNYYRKTFVKNS